MKESALQSNGCLEGVLKVAAKLPSPHGQRLKGRGYIAQSVLPVNPSWS